ncbi:SHOCT domain-containing protein [uncultured Thiothrix sp.]|uniref:SHOCT domain-containing protein n=1 Tax=uncultured Thiothrix sp. TaxID=223185 RepID=UPI00262FDCC9|nr:SHOCT domain-containing protein [uncultured Thiothrix sp.]
MLKLTPEGQALVEQLAQRYNLSPEAVKTMLDAIYKGQGTMAQFNHPELGGFGQWMLNGMSMIGDMFNQNLKSTVDNLGNDLSSALASGSKLIETSVEPDATKAGDTSSNHSAKLSGQWWPSHLGSPSTSGAQNNTRYAWFPSIARLAIEQDGKVTLYDTQDHQIGGVSQQQDGSGYKLSFTSQHGTIKVESLPVVK